MINIRKIVVGLGVLGVLATQSFSKEADVKLDSNFCKAYNYATYNYLKTEKLSPASRKGLKEGADILFSNKFGTLSTDFLKENGIGYSVSMTWGNIDLAFADFLLSLNNEEQIELRKFQLSTFYFSNWKISLIDNGKQSFRETVYVNTMITYNNFVKGEISEDVGDSILTNSFAEARGKEKEIFSPFARYVINKDYKTAIAYISEINEQSGINKIYDEFENVCEKK